MVSNPNFYGQSTTGTPNQIEDGVDFPHTGIIKALADGLGQNYAISGFDITTDSATQIDVGAGVIFRDGKRVSISAVTNLILGRTNASENSYHLVVVDKDDAIVIRSPSAKDKVAEYTARTSSDAQGDTIVAVVTHDGNDPMPIQYLTVDKAENSLSIGRSASGTYTEEGTITAASGGGIDIVTTQSNQDIRITPNGTGKVVIDGINHPTSDGGNGDLLQTNGSGDLSFVARSSISLSNHLTVSGNFSDVADKSAAYKRLVGNATLTALGSSLVGTDEVLIRDVSESNVEVKPKTVTAQTIADLYSETDTLADVTGRGASTTTALTLGEVTLDGLINEGETELSPVDPGTSGGDLPSAGFNDTAYYVNATTSLADGTNGQVIHLKNVGATAIQINTSSPIDGSGVAPDNRRSSSTQITLEPMEGITLQFVTGVTDVGNGWYIIDTDTGITNQLAETLDANGNNINFDDATGIQDSNSNEQLIFQETASAVNYLEITNAATTNDPKLSAAGSDTNVGIEIETKGTGEITLDGDVVIDGSHKLTAPVLDAVSSSAATYNLAIGTNAGKYLIYSGTGTVNLPSSAVLGEQYTILNVSSGDITVGRNGNEINGSAADITVGTFNGVTCICIDDTNDDWIALGV